MVDHGRQLDAKMKRTLHQRLSAFRHALNWTLRVLGKDKSFLWIFHGILLVIYGS